MNTCSKLEILKYKHVVFHLNTSSSLIFPVFSLSGSVCCQMVFTKSNNWIEVWKNNGQSVRIGWHLHLCWYRKLTRRSGVGTSLPPTSLPPNFRPPCRFLRDFESCAILTGISTTNFYNLIVSLKILFSAPWEKSSSRVVKKNLENIYLEPSEAQKTRPWW